MSWNPNATDRSANSTQFGDAGLYDPTNTQEDSSLKVQLGEHLDPQTRSSLESGQSPMTGSLDSMMQFVKRNPIPLALAAGGLVWLLMSGSRRFRR